MAVLNCQKPGRCKYYNEWKGQSDSQNLTLRELWRWLTECSIPKDKIDGQPTRGLFYFQLEAIKVG